MGCRWWRPPCVRFWEAGSRRAGGRPGRPIGRGRARSPARSDRGSAAADAAELRRRVEPGRRVLRQQPLGEVQALVDLTQFLAQASELALERLEARGGL